MKFQKSIFLIIFIFMFTTVFSFSTASASKKVSLIPKLQIVTQPEKEYKNGGTISFAVTSPNYGGAVQYRVILYNGTTKKTTNLWQNAQSGYYYTGWQPSGNYCFGIHWPVNQMEPGAYSMTVLVRRAGTKVSYDSFVNTNSFWVIQDGVSDKTSSSVSVKDITLAGGIKYSGETVNDVPNGKGTAVYIGGDKYDGMWKDGKRNGKGNYIFLSGDKYDGEWKDGLYDGYGIYIWIDGDKYEGYFKNDKRNGKGTFTFSCGDKYVGEWKEGLYDGYGIYTWVNGDKYEGYFKDNERNGKGIFTFSSGDKYDGEWKEGLYDGFGIYKWKNGDKYEGQWKANKKNGKGIYTYANGERNEGEWIDDVEVTVDNKVLAPPTGVKVEAESSSKVKITWNSVESVDYFKIYYSTSLNGTYNGVPNVELNNENRYTGNLAEITLTNPEKNWIYFFKVTAVKNGVESKSSDIISLQYWAGNQENNVDNKSSSIPTGLWAKVETSSKILMHWNAVESADYYKIYFSTSIDGPYKGVPNTLANNENKYSGEGDSEIQLYNAPSSWVIYFKVTSVKNGVESGYSNSIRVVYP